MNSLLVWALVAAVCAVAVWVGQLVRQLNDRFDQIEHKLDIVVDRLDREPHQ